MTTAAAPPTPTKYAPYYCEENIWWLCQAPELRASRRRVLVISNPARACALYAQRAAVAVDQPVLWDYHVVLWEGSGARATLWDLDCSLGAPLSFVAWFEATVQPALRLPSHVHPRFRVVEADEYVAAFSSDRTHMAGAGGGPHAPWPPWPPIEQGPCNLARFIDMETPFLGDVWGVAELRWHSGAWPDDNPWAPSGAKE